MKTWEMIKELTENPGKKFKRVGDELEVSVDIDNCLLWKSGHHPFSINHVWEEVKEPVDFMTAIENALINESRILVEHEYIDERYIDEPSENYYVENYYGENYYGKWLYIGDLMHWLSGVFDSAQLTTIITDGKWYIEEEE